MGASNYQMALTKRYSRLTGQLQDLRREIVRIKAAHKKLPVLQARITELEPLIKSLAVLLKAEDASWRPDLAPPIKPWKYAIPVPFGSTSRRGMEVLRRADLPMTAREIALQVLHEAGVETPSPEIVLRTTNAIGASLRKFEGRTVMSSGKYPAQWRVIHKPHIKFDV